MSEAREIQSAVGRVFKKNCPHCHTKEVAFTVVDGVQYQVSRTLRKFDLLGQCGHCDRGVIATFHVVAREDSLREALMGQERPFEMFPTWTPPSAPPYTPDEVARYFIQGMDNVPKNWDAAGAMFRKALEAALKHKFSDLSGTLFSRIQQAAKRHDLTPELAKWSDQIRIEGNKAVHDEGPYQKEEARQLEAFTDMVFRYLFTLPGMLQERKQQLSPHQDDLKKTGKDLVERYRVS